MLFLNKIVVLLSLTYALTCHELMKTLVQRCTSKCNTKYCKIISGCRPINRTSKLLSVDIYFHPGVQLDAPIYIEVNAYKKFTTVYRPFMIKLKDELCAQLIQKDHIFYKMSTKDSLATMGNLLDPCPFKGHRHVIPTVTKDTYFFFPLIPVGEWRFDVVFWKNTSDADELVASFSIFYEIKPRGAEEF